jgi:hypothetical protein
MLNANTLNFPDVPTHKVLNAVIPPVRVVNRVMINDDPDDDGDDPRDKKRKINKGGRPKVMSTIVKELVTLADDAILSKSMNADTLEELIKSKVPKDISKFINIHSFYF